MQYTFHQLFDVSEAQKLADSFARAAGIGIIIAEPGGPAITRPSSTSPLCTLILNTEAGRRNCADFVARFNRRHEAIPEYTCAAGLHTGAASITVEGRQIASLLIGQVLHVGQDIGPTIDYCKAIGVEERACLKALERTLSMTQAQFMYMREFIYKSVRLISKLALRNLRQSAIIKQDAAIEARLAEEKEFFRTTINSIGDAVITMNTDGIVLTMNDAAEALMAFTKMDAVGKHFSNTFVLLHEKTRKRFTCPIKENLQRGTAVASEAYLLQAADGSEKHIAFNCSPIQDVQGGMLGAVLVFRDISELKKKTEQMEYLSYHDSLTGLYNRAFFEQTCETIQRKHIIPVSIIVGDANGLKHTNDLYGHAEGDQLLKTIADAFRNSCRSDDVIARWGGDEFAAILPGLTYRRARAIMNDIHKYCAAARGNLVKASVALGLATKELPDVTLTELFNRAGKKMYKAKQHYKAKHPLT